MSSYELQGNVVRVGRDAGVTSPSGRPNVAIGFGSPADDTGVTRLDLNDILIKHPQATFLMRVTGEAMHEVGIDDGDVVLVDRAITPAHGHVVIAVVEDEFVCRRLSSRTPTSDCRRPTRQGQTSFLTTARSCRSGAS